MGRYYNGDIEGKFWFGVQSSDDGEFFGAIPHEPNYINYSVEEIEPVEEGIQECHNALGDNLMRFDDFFNSLEHGYNEEMIMAWYKDKYNKTITEGDIRNMLEWYARLRLGEKIYDCMKEHGECHFEAEL
jgi:hypothetical protein